MAITDADQLTEVAWRVVDTTLFPSALWTVAEIAAYFNERQHRFNRDTKLMLAHQPVTVNAGTTQATFPQDYIALQRATWKDLTTGIITPLDKSDRFAAAHGILSVNPPDRPLIIDDQSGGTLTGELFPVPVANGELGLLYATTLELLNFNPALPDIFDIPDEFVPFVTYGVLSDMLSKEGRGQDLERAKYCEERYQEGVLIAGMLLEGFMG